MSFQAILEDVFKGKKVLITGNTGFKGCWLSLWLMNCGANVIGCSNKELTNPSMFKLCGLDSKITTQWLNIEDYEPLQNLIKKEKPDFIFHFAAQAIVGRGLKAPLETFRTNVLGTSNLLEAVRTSGNSSIVILATSDKCYDNKEWIWGYREIDRLGGKDPYSASKGAKELIIRSYFESYFKGQDSAVRIASVRSGNVIGGGDWAESRLIPDCIRAWENGRSVELRSPRAVRPWQHVLDPLAGYLTTAIELSKASDLNGEAFNFGPSNEDHRSVEQVVTALSSHWKETGHNPKVEIRTDDASMESNMLKLNIEKASVKLNWQHLIKFDQMISMTAAWYQAVGRQDIDLYQLSLDQIGIYNQLYLERKPGLVIN